MQSVYWQNTLNFTSGPSYACKYIHKDICITTIHCINILFPNMLGRMSPQLMLSNIPCVAVFWKLRQGRRGEANLRPVRDSCRQDVEGEACATLQHQSLPHLHHTNGPSQRLTATTYLATFAIPRATSQITIQITGSIQCSSLSNQCQVSMCYVMF